jgi:amino acid transporter
VADKKSGERNNEKLGWNAAWSMAVGGMIGGGIFSVLGVVVEHAREYAAVSFVLGGLVALATADSYVRLAHREGRGGGAFTYVRSLGRRELAGSLAWVLTFGYVLTMSVYAFTFGHYLGEVLGVGPFVIRAAAVAIIVAFVAVNAIGVRASGSVEVFTVWAKVIVLVGLAIIGLAAWNPSALNDGVEAPGVVGVLVGAATVFMAYEGFQLVTYDYDDIRSPERTIGMAIIPAVIAVTGIYVVVAIGTGFLIGAESIVENREVALAIAGDEALGAWGKVIVSFAALFSTASAINATLFATARLARDVADDHQMPGWLAAETPKGVPFNAIGILGLSAAVLAAVGSLGALVEAASLIFLVTFAVVNVVAAVELDGRRWAALLGAGGATGAAAVLIVQLGTETPLHLAGIVGVVVAIVVARRLAGSNGRA